MMNRDELVDLVGKELGTLVGCEICDGFADVKEYRPLHLHVRLCWEHQLDLDAILHDMADRFEQTSNQIYDWHYALCGLGGDGKARDRILGILSELHVKLIDARLDTAANIRNWIAERHEEWLQEQADRENDTALRKAGERLEAEREQEKHNGKAT